MDYVFTTRSLNQSTKKFTNNLATITRYIKLPTAGSSENKGRIVARDKWIDEVLQQAENREVLIYVHGFNNHQNDMIRRHRKIRNGLRVHGYKGAMVSFGWPSDFSGLQYPKGVRVSQKAAPKLVLDGIIPLLKARANLKVHILAHSMGSLVVRFGFAKTANTKIAGRIWKIGKVLLVAADVHSACVSNGNSKSKSLLTRCSQLTNYHSSVDSILWLSENTFWDNKPRLGYIGAPNSAFPNLVDINCRNRYVTNKNNYPNSFRRSHVWYFHDPRFYSDVAHVIKGSQASPVFPTRARNAAGEMFLR